MRYVGERVIVVSEKTNFRGMPGEVTQTEPGIMVLLDGERLPMAFGLADLIGEEESSPHFAGAE